MRRLAGAAVLKQTRDRFVVAFFHLTVSCFYEEAFLSGDESEPSCGWELRSSSLRCFFSSFFCFLANSF